MFGRELQDLIRTKPLLSFDDYVSSVLKRKRAAYIRGKELFDAKPIIPNEMEIVVKPDEKQHHKIGNPDVFSDKYKPRNIYNPKEQVKGVCGWVMQIIMGLTKKYSSMALNFAAGCSPEELCNRLTKCYNSLSDPVFLYWDGARHDSLQHIWFLRDVDNKILCDAMPVLGPYLGMTSAQIDAIVANLTALWTDVTLTQKIKNMRKKQIIRLLKARVYGTVFSGHPSRTTFGNTIRILFLSMFIAHKCGIRWNKDMFHFQAGDDTLIIIERWLAEKFQLQAQDVYKNYGLIMQGCTISDTFEFLSRRGFYEQGKVHLRRMEDRVVQTGLYSTKVVQEDMPAFDKAITAQLSSWGSEMVGVKQFVRWRRGFEVRTNKRSEQRVNLALADQWNILSGPDQLVESTYAQEDKAYVMLDACLGNPILSWIRNA